MCSSRGSCGWARRMLTIYSWVVMNIHAIMKSTRFFPISNSSWPFDGLRPLIERPAVIEKVRKNFKGVVARESNCSMPDFAFLWDLLLSWGGFEVFLRSVINRKLNWISGRASKLVGFKKKLFPGVILQNLVFSELCRFVEVFLRL